MSDIGDLERRGQRVSNTLSACRSELDRTIGELAGLRDGLEQLRSENVRLKVSQALLREKVANIHAVLSERDAIRSDVVATFLDWLLDADEDALKSLKMILAKPASSATATASGDALRAFQIFRAGLE